MEVFSACIRKTTAEAGFKFHWRTAEVKLHHIIFADDVFLFSRGDSNSVAILMKGVQMFTNFSGLVPNRGKSTCFFANVKSEVKEAILLSTGFSQGCLPMSYLGLPLITTKLLARDCVSLVSKLCMRIEAWTAIFLNFAGRLQLIKSIMASIVGYWSMYIFLPKGVLKEINGMLFKFLWGGFYKTTGKCHYKVSWEDCCKPKGEGGLGIKNLFEWNMASILFQLWRIINSTADSLWIAWFKTYMLRTKGMWTAPLPYKCAWVPRKILNAREHAMKYVSYQVGRNSKFLFWHDPWACNKPLVQISSSVISTSESTSLVTVDVYLRDGIWDLPCSNHVDVIEVRRTVAMVQVHQKDCILWDGLKPHLVKIGTIWESFRQRGTYASWWGFIWDSLCVPKCSFTTWLAIKNRLLTKDRMLRFGMRVDTTCLLCKGGTESWDHLFGSCSYVMGIRSQMPFTMAADWPACQRGNFFNPTLAGKIQRIAGVFFTTMIYHVWKERNFRMHNVGKMHAVGDVATIISRTVRERLYSSPAFKQWVRQDQNIILYLF